MTPSPSGRRSMGVILTGYAPFVTRARASALVAAATLVAGCGGADHRAATTATAPKLAPRPDPFDARKTVDAFLYAPRQPARVCPKLWVATPSGKTVTIQAGDRQPTPQ